MVVEKDYGELVLLTKKTESQPYPWKSFIFFALVPPLVLILLLTFSRVSNKGLLNLLVHSQTEIDVDDSIKWNL